MSNYSENLVGFPRAAMNGYEGIVNCPQIFLCSGIQWNQLMICLIKIVKQNSRVRARGMELATSTD